MEAKRAKEFARLLKLCATIAVAATLLYARGYVRDRELYRGEFYTLALFSASMQTAVAAIVVGIVEAFSSFYARNFKEVIVFTLILPVLVLRSLAAPQVEEEKD